MTKLCFNPGFNNNLDLLLMALSNQLFNMNSNSVISLVKINLD
jgi:hypothetical protein